MSVSLCPYLNFDGDAAKAMAHYKSVLGGELTVQTFGEAFPDTAPDFADRIMHAHLESDGINIMASDTHPEHSPPHVEGNNVHLSLVGADQQRLTAYFQQLADGGSVSMPLEKQFWGDTFGALTDRFGVHWMVNISSA